MLKAMRRSGVPADQIAVRGSAVRPVRWCCLSLGLEAVPHAADGFDDGLAEFAPQVAHVYVDEIGPGVEVHAPGHGQQLLPGQDLAGWSARGAFSRESSRADRLIVRPSAVASRRIRCADGTFQFREV